jgi:hypothetical protein
LKALVAGIIALASLSATARGAAPASSSSLLLCKETNFAEVNKLVKRKALMQKVGGFSAAQLLEEEFPKLSLLVHMAGEYLADLNEKEIAKYEALGYRGDDVFEVCRVKYARVISEGIRIRPRIEPSVYAWRLRKLISPGSLAFSTPFTGSIFTGGSAAKAKQDLYTGPDRPFGYPGKIAHVDNDILHPKSETAREITPETAKVIRLPDVGRILFLAKVNNNQAGVRYIEDGSTLWSILREPCTATFADFLSQAKGMSNEPVTKRLTDGAKANGFTRFGFKCTPRLGEKVFAKSFVLN